MKKLCVFLLSIFILLTLSCEIGLGSSVDTESPSLEIQNPPADAVIRDPFAITGIWGDDGSISSITVDMVRLDNNASKKYTGSIQTGSNNHSIGTWKISIDPVKDGLADGNYEALVAIRDNGGHVTTMARSFTIDNTPPVLILTKPNSTFTENSTEDPVLSVYGKNLFLEGSIADLTKETWIEMKFYSDSSCSEESYLYTIETDSIAPTNVNQNNTKFAVYEEVEEDGVIKLKDNEYHKIYNRNEKSGAIPVYAKLTIYDIAESYSDNSANGTENISSIKKHVKGNHTQAFYISSDLAKDITKSKGNGGYGFAPIDIYNFFNGTLSQTDDARAISKKDQETIKDLLASKEKATSVFSINPDNNPYFTVSGLKTLTDPKTNFSSSENGYYIKNGAMSLEISVFMGSDSFELDADSEDFYAYLIECDENGNPIKEDKESNRIKLYSKYKETGSGASKKLLYKVAGKEGHKTTSGAYVFFAPISKTVNTNTDEGSVELPLQYGHMYLIRVNGKDTEGNLIDNESSKYGFKFTSSGAAPVITITEPEKPTKRLKKGDKLLLRGTVDSEEGGITLSLLKDNQIVNQDITLTDTELATRYAFEYEMKAEEFDQEHSHDYTIMLKASGAESSASASRLISYDVAGPVVNITDVSPVCKKENDNTDYINGLVTISGIITDVDDVFDSGAYEVIQKDSEPPVLSGIIDKNKFTFTVDTTSDKLLDKTPVTIKIRAKDRAGNETIEPLNFVIDQTTDKPKIGSKASLKYNATIDELENGDFNLFTKTSTLYLDIDDDDGAVKNVEVTLAPYNTTTGVQGSIVDEYTQTFANTTVAAFRFPDVTGYFLVSVKAEDSNFTSQTASPNNYTVENFYVRLTGSGPDVSIAPEKEYLSLKAGSDTLKLEFTVSGEDEDTYSLDLINYIDGVKNVEHVFGHDAAHPKQTSPFIFEKEYSEIPAAEDRELKFTVKDKTGVGTDKSFTPKFDSASPTVDFDEEGYPAHDSDTDNASFYFKGSVGDSGTLPDNPSGIKEVKIFFKDGEVTDNQTAAYPADNAEDWITTISTPSTWSYLATWASDDLKAVFQDANGKAKEGKKSVFVKAFDKAGNDNETVVYKNFIYDISAPEVTEITGKEYTNENTLTLTIKVKDTNAITPDVVLYKGDVKEINKQAASCIESVNQTGTGPDANGLFTYTVKINFPTIPATEETLAYIPDGTYNITVTPKDSNGRVGNVKTFRSIRDTELPKINNVGLVEVLSKNNVIKDSKDVYYSSDENGKKYYSNNELDGRTYKISGVSTDNVGIESVKLIIDNTAIENAATSLEPEQTADSDTGLWKYEGINLSTWKTGAKAAISVIDLAGNKETSELNIIFDVTAPKGIHAIDAASKDLYFRIGKNDNDSVTDKFDEDVGGKYSKGTFGNATTIQIRGNFEETGSGVSRIYYRVYPTERLYTDTAGLEVLKNEVITEPTGEFSPLTKDKIQKRRVFYNVGKKKKLGTDGNPEVDEDGNYTYLDEPDEKQIFAGSTKVSDVPNEKGYYQYCKEIESNFNESISGFSEGANYLVLVVVDNAGNSAVDTAIVNYNGAATTFVNYILNVDKTPPSDIKTLKPTGIIYTNGNNMPVIWGTVSDKSSDPDAAAGIKSFVISRDGVSTTVKAALRQITATDSVELQTLATTDSTLRIWEADVSSLLPYLDDNQTQTISLSATVTDNAGTGNTTPGVVTTITVDTGAPTVEIDTDSPSDADTDTEGRQVNGNITITGTAEDSSGVTEVSGIYYNVYSGTVPQVPSKNTVISASGTENGWKPVTATLKGSTNTWKYENIDTKLLEKAYEENEVHKTNVCFTVAVKDKAGNIGYSPAKAVVIDQDTDRPIVSFSTVSVTYGKDGQNNLIPMSSANYTWLKNSTTLVGTVTDDDGVRELLIGVKHDSTSDEITYKSISIKEDATVAPWSLNLKDLYTGTDEEKEALANGRQVLYFKVKDKENSTSYFEYTTNNSSRQVKLSDDTTTLDTSILYLKVDTMPPQTEFNGIWYKAEGAESEAYNNASGFKLGGAMRTYKIKATASDANGITDVSAKTTFGSKIVNATSVKIYNSDNVEITSKTNGIYEGLSYVIAEFTLTDADISALSDFSNSATITFTAKDAAGNSQSSNANFAADYKKPVITVSGPSSTQYCSGTVTSYGTVDTSAKVYFAISTGNTDDEAPGKTVTTYSYAEEDGTEKTDGTMLTGHQAIISDYQLIKDTSLSWYIYFDGDTEKPTGSHIITLNNYLVNYWIAPHKAGSEVVDDIENSFNRFVKLYIWLKAEDEYGNISEVKKYPLFVDPQGDRPSVTIDFPSKTGETLGGKVTLRGSALDPNGTVQDVWVQLISKRNHSSATNILEYDENSYDITKFAPAADDVTQWIASGYKVYAITNNQPGNEPLTSVTGQTPANCYIKANFSGSSWNLPINVNKEFDPATGVTENEVGYRVYARDNDNKFSRYAQQLVRFDADNPVLSDIYLKQYSDNANGTGTVIATREYADDMWIRGTWWLTGTASDSNNISQVDIGSDYSERNLNVPSFDFRYKLETTGVGNLGDKFTIVAYDKVAEGSTPHTITKKISINYDNDAPELSGAEDSDYALSPDIHNSDGFYTLGSKVTEAAEGLASQSGLDYVAFYFMRRGKQFNSTTISNTVSKIYNPMFNNNKTAYQNDAKEISNATTLMGAVSETDIVYDSGLYWIKKSVTRTKHSPSVIEFNTTDTAIMPGGLVKLNGAVYYINNISNGTTVTLDGLPEYSYAEDSKSEIAYFALALIVNNTAEESGSGRPSSENGYYSKILNNDGDGIVEYVKKRGYDYYWSADICSKNIPDGPIELHYIVFDKAGNYSIGILGNLSEANYRGMATTDYSYTPDIKEYKDLYDNSSRTSNVLYVDGVSAATVNGQAGEVGSAGSIYNTEDSAVVNDNYKHKANISNNSPRLANVQFGTDLNGDGEVTGTELQTVYTSSKTWADKCITMTVGSETSGLVVKGKTIVKPEILGGNGSLYYDYNISDKDNTKLMDGYNETAFITGTADGENGDSRTGQITMELGDFLRTKTIPAQGETPAHEEFIIPDCKQNEPHKAEFNIWDSTEGTNPFDRESQNVNVKVYLSVDMRDTDPPKVEINPLYWNSVNDNSIYGSSNATSVTELAGHIELDELEGKDTTETDAVRNEYGNDPKVSGGVVIKGKVKDNTRIKSIYISVPGMEKHFGNGDSSAGITGAKLSSIKVKNFANVETTFYLMAIYDDANATWNAVAANTTTNTSAVQLPLDKWADEGFKFNIDSSEFSQNGHEVTWTLSWNTEFISTVAAKDVKIQVLAIDEGTPAAQILTEGANGYATGKIGLDGVTRYAPALPGSGNMSKTKADGSTIVQTTNTDKTSLYQMDVVPYIAGVKTGLSKLKKTNSSVYDRTALGHYTTYTTDDVYIYGFNLSGGELYDKENSSTTLTEVTNTTEPKITDLIWYSENAVPAGRVYKVGSVAGLKSGKASVKINSVQSLNNLNNNDSKGAYTGTVNLEESTTGNYRLYNEGYYNRLPNNDSNNLLTDDVIIDVWEIDSNAAVPFNNSGKIIQPVMKINPVTDQLGFAFSSSSGYFSMPGKTMEAQAGGAGNWNGRFVKNFNKLQDYSYTFWSGELNEFESIGLAYDNLGHSYGTAAGGNINAGASARVDFFSLFTDRWGKGLGDISDGNNNGHHKSSKSGYNAIRLEPTGIKDGTNLIDKGRIRKPSLVTTTHGTNTNVYLAYFDTLTGQIRFRAGNTGDKTSNTDFYKIASYVDGYYNFDFSNLFGKSPVGTSIAYIYENSGDEKFVLGPLKVRYTNFNNRTFTLYDNADAQVTTNYKNKYIKVDNDPIYYQISNYNNKIYTFAVRPPIEEEYVSASIYENYGDITAVATYKFKYKEASSTKFELYNDSNEKILIDYSDNYIKLENNPMYYQIITEKDEDQNVIDYSFDYRPDFNTIAYIYDNDGDNTVSASYSGPYQFKYKELLNHRFYLYNANGQQMSDGGLKNKFIKLNNDSSYYSITDYNTKDKYYTFGISIPESNSIVYLYDNYGDTTSVDGPYKFNYNGTNREQFFLSDESGNKIKNKTLVKKYLKFENDQSYYLIQSYNEKDLYYTFYFLKNNIISDGNRVEIYSNINDTVPEDGPYIIQNYVQNTKFQLIDESGIPIYKNFTNKYIKLVPEQSKGNFGTFYDRWGLDISQDASNIAADNYDYVAVVAGVSGREASDYFSLGVVQGNSATDDTVFLIWYDEADMTLYYSYTTDYTTASSWSPKTRVFPSNSTMANAGEYCQIIADAKGGVHIAALDPSNSDLVYAYLPSSKNSTDFTTCVVDSNGIVGDSLTIDVAINSDGKAIPTIGYYSSSTKRPKMAYLAEPEKANLAGAISDYFTGVWECTVVPTEKTLDFSNANLVNLGMFKGTTGYLKNSGINSETSVYENYLKSGEAYYGSHYGIKYGNGTSNAVLGYVVKINSSLMHIETAQMR